MIYARVWVDFWEGYCVEIHAPATFDRCKLYTQDEKKRGRSSAALFFVAAWGF